MPQCKKCDNYFPPQFLVQMINFPNEPEALQCLYCSENKSEIKIKQDGEFIPYSKKECIKDYDKLLKKLKENKNITQVLSDCSNQKSLIIQP